MRQGQTEPQIAQRISYREELKTAIEVGHDGTHLLTQHLGS